ncbi:hypothetical protein VTJ49DRAFT_6272 [Mycothermus thermophilus]|uniref:Luciferase domain-containing protein n=1 Tax=Humicola insolens TaxID=85995 RepID=A0ABR3VJ83_HUMIN
MSLTITTSPPQTLSLQMEATEEKLPDPSPHQLQQSQLQPHPALPIPPSMPLRQDRFHITLDAWALLALSTVLVLAMHSISRPVLDIVVLSIPLGLLAHNDYLNFLKLGPGGTPPTPAGWARLTFYRLFTLKDPFRAPRPEEGVKPATGILTATTAAAAGGDGDGDGHVKAGGLPYRPGPRPSVAGLAPQRQLDQHGCSSASARLRASLAALATQRPADFVTATSCLEKHGLALFARKPVNVCGNGEVCHVHNTDRSMHLNLHPEDIREVLEKGWGQRHPMSWERGDGWLGGMGVMVEAPLPRTFVMIYAPRNDEDLRVIARIIEAAIWYTTAERTELELVPETSL